MQYSQLEAGLWIRHNRHDNEKEEGYVVFIGKEYFTLCVKEWVDKKLLHGIGQSLLLIYREQIGDCEIIESLRNTPSISNYKSQEHRYQDIQ